jgi:excinuclease ABC subunit A
LRKLPRSRRHADSDELFADVYVRCDSCNGKRYNEETLQVTYKGKNIYEVLEMTVEDSLSFFENRPKIRRKLQTLLMLV